MSGLAKTRVVVAGGGALGSSIALVLAQAGARVTLVDPGQAPSASGVAAGMLAPAFEAVLDPEGGLSFDVLRQARDLWPAFAQRLGGDIGPRRTGAAWVDLPGAPARAEAIAEGLRRIGADVESPPAGMAPRAEGRAAVFTPDDWRIAPAAALAVLAQAFADAGGETVRARVEGFEGGQVWLSDGARLAADHLVVATGAEGAALAPELAALIPIKGQILKYPDLIPPGGAPTLRCAGGYATGGADGLSVGATMEIGRADRAIDPAVSERLHALAIQLYPEAAAMTPIALTGVRAATSAGPPIVAPSSRPGVFVAAGARRNGWLLAPLVARMVMAYLSGAEPGPHAALLRATGRSD